MLEIPTLRDRSLDLVLARMRPLAELRFADDLNVEVLFDEKLVVVSGAQSPWARRRKIDLADLANEPWLLNIVRQLELRHGSGSIWLHVAWRCRASR